MRNNRIKKSFAGFLAVVLLFVSMVTVSAVDIGLPFDPVAPDVRDPDVKSGICGVGDKLTWSFNIKTGVLTVFGNGAMKDRTSTSKVPWRNYLADIKTVVIFPGITKVGSYAFYGCTAATSVVYCGTGAQWNSVEKGTNWLPSSVRNVKIHSFSEDKCIGCGRCYNACQPEAIERYALEM